MARGIAYRNVGQIQLAINDFDRALDLAPAYAEAYVNRAAVYSTQGQYHRAIKDLDEAILLVPDLALAYNNRGSAYRELGQPQKAIEDMDESISLDPDDFTAYYNRGSAYLDLGEAQRAVEDLDKSIDFYTRHLGMQLLRKKDFEGGRFTLAFVGYGDEESHAVVELTHNWDQAKPYDRGDGFGHLAVAVPG